MQLHPIWTFISLTFSVAAAVRFDLTNVTCTDLHGVHCGTYALKVADVDGAFLGQKTFVGADVLATGAEDAWGRFLSQETRFLPRLTTVGTNETKNFSPFYFTTNHETCNPQSIEDSMIPFVNTITNEIQFDAWAYTAMNVSVPTGLANQLFNATDYGVQIAQCYNGIASELLDAPTVNIFDKDEVLPSYCSPIKLEAVCPIYVTPLFE